MLSSALPSGAGAATQRGTDRSMSVPGAPRAGFRRANDPFGSLIRAPAVVLLVHAWDDGGMLCFGDALTRAAPLTTVDDGMLRCTSSCGCPGRSPGLSPLQTGQSVSLATVDNLFGHRIVCVPST